MKKVTKAEQAKRQKVAQKRADYTKSRSKKVMKPLRMMPVRTEQSE